VFWVEEANINMKSFGRSVVSAAKGRSLAGQAAVKQTEQRFKPSPQDVKITKLPSGIVVASLEDYSPVSRLAVVYNAGSRYEPADNLGITHSLRVATNLSSKKATAFSIAKHIQQIGGDLSCTTHREQVFYSVSCLRKHLATGVDILNNVATGQVFKPWEVSDSASYQKKDLAVYLNSPEAQLIEALHKVAYRDTLGQSLYMRQEKVGKFSPQSLEAFVKSHYVSHNAAVTGIGVDHDALVHLARKLTVAPGQAPEKKKAKYHGGEHRIDQVSPLVHAAIVTEGLSFESTDVLALGVLQLVLGTGPYVKYSSNLVSSKIGKAAAAATSNPFAASAICASYSDSGLFGFQVTSAAKDAGKVLKAIIGVLGQATKSSVTDAEVQRAKLQLKACINMDAESAVERLHWIGAEVLLSGQVIGLDQFDSAIDKITLEDVNKVAKKIVNGKPSMVAIGDLTHTPYLDELV
jgi:ubiquinol-cytochrome c reductase core subunit 2